METIKVSPKYQIVIPRKIRESLGLRPGIRLQVIEFEDRIELIPVRTPESLRGTLTGLNTDVPRDEDRV